MSQRTARLAIIILGLCCVCWGFSFPAMQIGAERLDRAVLRGQRQPSAPGAPAAAQPAPPPLRERLATRGAFNGWRFAIAGLICAVLALASRGRMRYRHNELAGGALIGAFFGAGMLLQICGLQYTLPSVSSFLTALAVVFAPIAQALVFRKRVARRVWLAVGIALAGIIVLSWGNPRAIGQGTLALAAPLPYLGEALTVLAAVLFTAQILAIDSYGQTADPAKLTAIMLLAAGAINLAIGAAAGGRIVYRAGVWSAISRDFTFIWTFAALVLISSVLAVQLMIAWQPRISPATAAVVYCLEPVFGTLFSVAFQTERLTAITLGGGAIILAAVLTIVGAPEEVHIGT